MIIGVEIAMFIMGLIAIFKGHLSLSRTIVVEGIAARLLGLVLLAPVPLVFTVALIWTVVINLNNNGVVQEAPRGQMIALEVGTLVVCGAFVYVFGRMCATTKGEPKRPKPARRELAEESE
ncbi:MAG: hypothetical protein HY290_01545 [Planctomycetia bacterium]|nr:hypothetical protein [Planctomycetia bacterium]